MTHPKFWLRNGQSTELQANACLVQNGYYDVYMTDQPLELESADLQQEEQVDAPTEPAWAETIRLHNIAKAAQEKRTNAYLIKIREMLRPKA